MSGIFYTVLNMSVTGTFIILALVILRLLLRNMPKSFSYALWAIPALRLLCPASVSSFVSIFNLIRPRSVVENRMQYVSPAQVQPPQITVTNQPAPTVTAAPSPADIPAAPSAAAVKSISAADVLPWIWLAVAIFVVIWCAASYIRVALSVRNSEQADGYFICKNIESPFVFGIFRPRIYLPEGLSDADALCILAHERAHIRRKDHLVKLLTVPVMALHWFNPAVWLGIKLMTTDMELSCDEKAINALHAEHKKDYANALLNISMKQNGISFSGLLGFGESDIKTRIKGVLKMKKPRAWAIIAAVLVIIISAVCLLTNAVSRSDALPNEIDGYISYKTADIPSLDRSCYADEAEFSDSAAPKILFAKTEAGGESVYLLGEGVYRDESEPQVISTIRLKLGISADGRHISSTCPAPAEFIGASQAHYKIREDDVPSYLSAFDMELPIIELNYIGEDSNTGAFYAVKDGELRLLMGDMSDIGGESPGACFGYTELVKGDEPNALIFNMLDSYGVEYTFDFDNIRSDEYIGPHFTAKRVGAAENQTDAEFEDIINRYILFEQIYTVDSLSIGSINGPDDREIGPDDGITLNGDLYYPVVQEGFTEWQQLEGFVRGLFTDELADAYLSDGRYIDQDGKTFSLMWGGGGWYVSPDYIYGTEELEDGRTRLDFYREWDSNEVGEYYIVKLILENTPDGYRIAENSQDHVTDYDSYDWLAPVNRFVQREFYFDPDFTGRYDAEKAGESAVSEIAHNVAVTFRYTSEGEFVNAFTDGRGEEVDEICALDENRLLVYAWHDIADQQIYLLNFETGETEPILSQTLSGYDFNYFAEMFGEDLRWVNHPQANPDRTKIVYSSNKYIGPDGPALSDSLWIYDISSGEESQIPKPAGASSRCTQYFNWIDSQRISFGCYEDDDFVGYIYNAETGRFEGEGNAEEAQPMSITELGSLAELTFLQDNYDAENCAFQIQQYSPEGMSIIYVYATDADGQEISETYYVHTDTGIGWNSADEFVSLTAAKNSLDSIKTVTDYLTFERIYLYGTLSYSGGRAMIDGKEYYPVTEEGFAEWRQLESFMNGLFTDDLAAYYLSNGLYTDNGGMTYVLDAGGKGSDVSDTWHCVEDPQDYDNAVLEVHREMIGEGDEGEYMITVLKLTREGGIFKIAAAENHYTNIDDGYIPLLSAEQIRGGSM